MKVFKTTEKQYKLFCEQCRKFQKFFGLLDFEIETIWAEKNKDHDAGNFDMLYPAHGIAVINFFRTWYRNKPLDNPITDQDVKEVAFHEICHLLFYDLLDNAADTDEIRKEEHRLINRLQNIFLDENGDLKGEYDG